MDGEDGPRRPIAEEGLMESSYPGDGGHKISSLWRLTQYSRSKQYSNRKSFAVASLTLVFFLTMLLQWSEFRELVMRGHLNAPQLHPYSIDREPIPPRLQKFQHCAIKNIEATNLDFLKGVKPIEKDEFISRRDRLVEALIKDNVDAFVVEPGYTFSYYANVTQKDWEVWEPEERPFLMIVQPSSSTSRSDQVRPKGVVKANTTFLVPIFEAERARLLGMPFEEDVRLVTYEEYDNPYAILAKSSIFPKRNIGRGSSVSIIVDEEMRDFISRGLASQPSLSVRGLSNSSVERVRQIKSPTELAILRAVNTGTVECIRAMRQCMTPGLSESDVALVLDNTMRSADLEPFFDIVLFDENASNPHGGTDGAKVLEKETFVLIDVGSHLYGYSSDVCRTFFPPFFDKSLSAESRKALSKEIKEKLDVWDVVFEAQSASLGALTLNHSAADVDLAARGVIEVAGYGEAFTHRVGHGIGIKAHESPYLHKGNTEVGLREGMVFTSEPGVYLVNKFGVRHEDVLLVTDETPRVLSGTRAKGPWEP